MNAEHRDHTLRAYFLGRTWDDDPELALKRRLVTEGHPALANWPLLWDDEWLVVPGRPDQGRGDLVFTDGHGRFAIVEVKVIDGGNGGGSGKTTRRKRTSKRRKIEEQARTYAAALASWPGVHEVVAFTWVDNPSNPSEGGLRPIGT